MLTCREITQLVASDDVYVAPIRKRLAIRLHLAMCRHCRRYWRELSVIRNTVRRNAGALLGAEPVDSERMHRILRAVFQEIRAEHSSE